MSSPATDARLDRPAPPATLVRLLAFACGLAVANVYVAQPLLDSIARSFAIDRAAAGVVVTVTQAGYALGLVLLVPLGDRLNPRALIVAHLAASSLAVAAFAFASSVVELLAAAAIIGLLAVVVQTIVAHAASLASDENRGTVVGTVTSGVVIGVLLSRAVAGVVADAAGWRVVYGSSAVLLLATALVLRRALPTKQRSVATGGASYGRLVLSTLRLFRDEPLLRRRGALAVLTFAAFSTLWTSLVLPLTSPPLALSHGVVGAFGLVGAAGALAAGRAGRLADRGRGGTTTTVALALLTVAWLPIGLLQVSLWALPVGLVLLDVAVQAVHVTSQTLLYTALAQARSRVAGAYMSCYSVGSAAGAAASTAVYARAGWTGVCVLGALISGAALVGWSVAERRQSGAVTRPVCRPSARRSPGRSARPLRRRPRPGRSG